MCGERSGMFVGFVQYLDTAYITINGEMRDEGDMLGEHAYQ